MIIIAGGALLLVMVVRAFWSRLRGLWEKAKQGGAILDAARRFVRVSSPSLGAWLAKLGVIAVFLAAFSIPATSTRS